jgi:hypothetical protein
MNNPNTLFRLERMFGGLCIDMHIGLRYADGTLARVTGINLEAIEPGAATPLVQHPSLQLSERDAQSLIDELWHLGIRPTEGHGSTGHLAATEKHLDHTTQLLTQTLQTVLNVANASLITQHGLKPAES